MASEEKELMYDEFEDEQEDDSPWFRGQSDPEQVEDSAELPERSFEPVSEEFEEDVQPDELEEFDNSEEQDEISSEEEPEDLEEFEESEEKSQKIKKSSQKPKKKKKRRRKKHRSARVYGVLIMVTLIFVISIVLSIGIIEIGKDMLGIDGTETLVVFNIPEGATTTEIAESLAQNGIIRIPKAFVYFSRLSDSDSKYIAGDHEVSSSMAYETIIKRIDWYSNAGR